MFDKARPIEGWEVAALFEGRDFPHVSMIDGFATASILKRAPARVAARVAFHCDAFVKRRIDSDLEILQAPTFGLEPADPGAMSRSSVIGNSRTRMPVACQTALATTPALLVMPISLTALMPSGERSSFIARSASRANGQSTRRRSSRQRLGFSPPLRRSLPYRSRKLSCLYFNSGDSRYVMIRREPVLISAVTAMPGVRLTMLSSICICVRSSEMRAA